MYTYIYIRMNAKVTKRHNYPRHRIRTSLSTLVISVCLSTWSFLPCDIPMSIDFELVPYAHRFRVSPT